VLIAIAFNVIRRGGIKAGIFNAKIVAKIGEVALDDVSFLKRQLNVFTLNRNSEALIGIEVAARSSVSYNMTPISLTTAQARQLANLLLEAVDE
jgi:hypothetical protein